MQLNLHLKLLSDGTFGNGDGVASLVDTEIEHDNLGLPFLRGRTLKGLLSEECANILFALEKQNSSKLSVFKASAQFLFGSPGSTINDDSAMKVGMAMLPLELRKAVEVEINKERLTSAEVLNSLTSIRRQTAINEKTGVAEDHSLRSLRVLLRQTQLTSLLTFSRTPENETLALLSACVLSIHRAGTGRNRGRGRLKAWLEDDEFTTTKFSDFEKLVLGEEHKK